MSLLQDLQKTSLFLRTIILAQPSATHLVLFLILGFIILLIFFFFAILATVNLLFQRTEKLKIIFNLSILTNFCNKMYDATQFWTLEELRLIASLAIVACIALERVCFGKQSELSRCCRKSDSPLNGH